MELLKIKGLNVNEATAKGTALHISVKLNHLEAVKLLIDKDADPKITDDKGRNCFDYDPNEECKALMKKNAGKQV